MTPTRIAAFWCVVSLMSAQAAVASPSKQTIYTCTLAVTKNQSWIPDQVVISVNKADGAVLVFDPIIRHFMSNPIPAKVVTETSERMTLKWNVKRVNKVEPNNMPTMVYTAKFTKNDNKIAINATPLGYDNRFFADGVCKVKN